MSQRLTDGLTLGKTHIDFDESELAKNPGTYERNLMAALIHSHRFYLTTKDSLCPWNSARGVRRPDFSITHYNVLYEAVASFWGMFGNGVVIKTPIPQSQLEAILIDWNNTGRVAGEIIEKILEEVRDDLYKMDLNDEFIEHGVMGKHFQHWLSTRLSKRAVEELSACSKSSILRFEDCQGIVDHYRSVQLNAESAIQAAESLRGRSMWDLVGSTDAENDPKELLKHRYLCREGGLLLVGGTGLGKSTFAMQCAIRWSLGQPAFGIEPKGVLKSLIIQAENDDGDMVEMFMGIADGLGLDENLQRTAGEKIIVVRENVRTGPAFFSGTVAPMLQEHKPDILWVDPALAFLGGEANAQKDVGNFLRNQLNPLLKQYQCGAVVLHHTPKPLRTNNGSVWTEADFAYAGAGSAEWCNWARAVLVIRGTEDPSFFEIKATKRGGRIGWKGDNGKTITKRHIAHSLIRGQLFWREPGTDEVPTGKSDESAEILIMDLVPAEGTIEKKELLAQCQTNDVKEKKARDAIKRLERFKKYCSHSERGFLGFGEALAKEHARRPATEPKRS
jgi:hypothetical protein